MYLLNRQQLIRHAEDTTSNYLTIYNFLKKNLQHTSYYYRLGDILTKLLIVLMTKKLKN